MYGYNSNTLVSIIVPSYNQGLYLDECLNSVLNQSFSEWECIVINNGSTDNTESVALKWTKTDSRFKYIKQENNGVCAARNIAVQQSIGKYLLCLDGDDKISENFLSELLKSMQEDEEIKVAAGRTLFFGERKGELLMDDRFDMENLLAINQITVTSLIKRKDFDRVGGFSINMKKGLEDWDLWIKILKDGGKVIQNKNAIFYYRFRKSSRNNSFNIENDLSTLRRQIWENNKDAFARYFLDPQKTSEYLSIKNSYEYKVGKIIIKPLRKIKRWIGGITNYTGTHS